MSLRTGMVEGFAIPPCERLTLNNMDKDKISLKYDTMKTLKNNNHEEIQEQSPT